MAFRPCWRERHAENRTRVSLRFLLGESVFTNGAPAPGLGLFGSAPEPVFTITPVRKFLAREVTVRVASFSSISRRLMLQ